MEILTAMDIFDASAMPPAGSTELVKYGEGEIKVLLKTYRENITVEMRDEVIVRHDAIMNDNLLGQWDILKSW